MKNYTKILLGKKAIVCLLLFAQPISSFASFYLPNDRKNKLSPSVAVRSMGIASPDLSQSIRLQTFDASALNLKNIEAQHSVQQINVAISVSLADFNTISAVGNTWLLYESNNATFSMNIGTANNASPQTWTLPANLPSYFQGAGRSDFVAPSSVPVALQVAGANKVMQTYYLDNNDQHMKVYDHYDLNNAGIDHIGTSYDLEVGTDDTFDEPNYEFADVPLDLNDNFTTTIEDKNYVTDLTLIKYIENITADAYGTITTPEGTFNCLRLSITKQKYTRPNESTAYTLATTTNEISFVTKEGAFFNAQVSATSGTATLSDFQYRKIVLTSSLSEANDVKLNNDSKGVSINTDNEIAHPSAILDVKSDNSGVLIPRIAMANRPASPATGLLIYQVDNGAGFYYYDGAAWQKLATQTSNMQVSARLNTFSETATLAEKGVGRLISGTTFIKFDRIIENPADMNINITPEGDCNGIYISEKTKEGFWVKELQKGKSNVKFSYSVSQNN
jgi:hypothetical protein